MINIKNIVQIGCVILTLSGTAYAGGMVELYDEFKTPMTALIERAEQGDLTAQYELANIYMSNTHEEVEQDYNRAAYWLQEASDQNYAPAENALAKLYQNGWGVCKHLPVAQELYKSAVMHGSAVARTNLAMTYLNI